MKRSRILLEDEYGHLPNPAQYSDSKRRQITFAGCSARKVLCDLGENSFCGVLRKIADWSHLRNKYKVRKQVYITWVRRLLFEVEKKKMDDSEDGELLEIEERDCFCCILICERNCGASSERRLKGKSGKYVAQVSLWSKVDGAVVGFEASRRTDLRIIALLMQGKR